MSFRDDRDALLARADAADAEAERLRADNARLRRDLAGSDDATPAPAPLIVPATAAAADATPPGTVEETAEQLAARAYLGEGSERAIKAIIYAGAGVGSLVALAIARSWIVLLGLVAGTVLGALLAIAFAADSQRRQREWLRRLELPLDRTAYARLLGVGRVRRRITLSAWASSVPEARRAAVAAQLRAAVPDSVVSWDGDRLELVSPSLVTWRQDKAGASFQNAPVHAWFRRVVEHGLLPALDGHRVERLEVA